MTVASWWYHGHRPRAAGLGGELEDSLRALAGQFDAERADRERRGRLLQDIHFVPIAVGQIPLAGGAGTLDWGGSGLAGPRPGYMWFIRRLTAASFSAGSVTAYVNGTPAALPDANILVEWPVAGTYTFNSGDAPLQQADRLIFAATGITGAVTISGTAMEFAVDLLPILLLAG